MEYDESDLWNRISMAVSEVFSGKKELTSSELTDSLFVKLKPIVMEEKRAYTIAQLRVLLTTLV